MESSQPYDYYRPTFYPTSFVSKIHSNAYTISVPKLTSLCAKLLSADSTFLSKHLPNIPINLYHDLMESALLIRNNCSIKVLISHWPWEIFKLKDLVPPMFSSSDCISSLNNINIEINLYMQYTILLVPSFLECLKKGTLTNLRKIDITHFPTAEVTSWYLASNMRLAQNERRTSKLLHLFDSLDSMQKVCEKSKSPPSLSNDQYIMAFDLTIRSDTLLLDFCRALSTMRSTPFQLLLSIPRLNLSSLGVARICLLLENISTESVTDIALRLNNITGAGLATLRTYLMKMENLKSLDLSSNFLYFSKEISTRELASGILSKLPQLNRLDLSDCHLRNVLPELFGSLSLRLTDLRLSGCNLTALDIDFLSSSQPCETLQLLDLSHNNLSTSFDNVIKIITKSQLKLLETESCNLLASHLEIISDLILSSKVEFLNLSGNACDELTLPFILTLLSKFAQSRFLQVLKLSHPIPNEEVSSMQKILQENLDYQTKVNRTCNKQLFIM